MRAVLPGLRRGFGVAALRGARALVRVERGIGQPGPDLGFAQQRNAQIPTHRKLLAIGAQVHARAVERAVARVEDFPVLVGEPLPLHALDERDAELRGVLLLAIALRAAPARRILSGLRKHPDDLALIGPVPVRDAEPAFRLAGRVALFPEARGGRLRRAPRVGRPTERE